MVELDFGYLQGVFDSFPEEQKILFVLFLYTFLIVAYSVFIWKFYKFLACREIIQLNLRQYNISKHPSLEKLLVVVLYTIEYLVILPFLVLFWFAILSLFLLFLSTSESAEQILLISAAIIASTRITSYISEDLSKDIAKILPLTILVLFIMGEKFFDIKILLERFFQIPNLFNHILVFLLFIFLVEFIFRTIYTLVQFFQSSTLE